MSSIEAGSTGGRVQRITRWLAGRTDTKIGRLSLQWFRGYMEASRNSGCAVTVYTCLSILPAALVAASYFHSSGSDTNAYASRLIDHLNLTGSTASLVRDTFGTAADNKLAASITVVISFLFWGIGIGQLYQDVYARAWRVKVGSAADQGLFAIFFFVLTGAVTLATVASAELHSVGWYAVVPAWLVGATAFWLWVPRFLLHRKIGLRALLPGALLGAVVLGGAAATSPLFVAAPLNQNAKAFGSFGVVLTMVGYVFIMITMSLACAVFSPVWANWREGERALREREDRPSPAQAGEADPEVTPT